MDKKIKIYSAFGFLGYMSMAAIGGYAWGIMDNLQPSYHLIIEVILLMLGMFAALFFANLFMDEVTKRRFDLRIKKLEEKKVKK